MIPTLPRPALATLGLAIITACGGPGDEAGAGSGAEAPAAEAPAPASSATDAPAEPAAATANNDDAFAALPAPYNTADYDRGRRTWRLCSTCHLTEDGAGHRVGPNLYGMFGKEVGTQDGFAYSDALLEADFVWTPERLEQWLADPRDFLPGNRMSFAGVRREDDRHAVIAYLMVETGWQPSGE